MVNIKIYWVGGHDDDAAMVEASFDALAAEQLILADFNSARDVCISPEAPSPIC